MDAGFVWEKGRQITLTLPRRWNGGNAVDLNDRGQVLLDSELAGDTNDLIRIQTLVWRSSRVRALETLPGWRIARAVALNNNGTAVGNAFPSYAAELKAEDQQRDAEGRAVVWRRGKVADLGTLGGNSSSATAISADGQIIGSSQTRQGTRHAFLWRQGRMHDLGALAGRSDSEAIAINKRGLIVGNGFTLKSGIESASRAFVWSKGNLTALGTLPGGKQSGAVAINNNNQIVGWSTTKSGRTHAALWTLRP